MVLLVATLFWALWDEAYGQRPWKAFQGEWQHRYGAFLNTAQSTSAKCLKEVSATSDYQQLAQAADQAAAAAKNRKDELQKQIADLNAQILAVQSVFTDKRAYVNALTYELETDDSKS